MTLRRPRHLHRADTTMNRGVAVLEICLQFLIERQDVLVRPLVISVSRPAFEILFPRTDEISAVYRGGAAQDFATGDRIRQFRGQITRESPIVGMTGKCTLHGARVKQLRGELLSPAWHGPGFEEQYRPFRIFTQPSRQGGAGSAGADYNHVVTRH